MYESHKQTSAVNGYKVAHSNYRDYLVNQETQDPQAYLVERDFLEPMYTILL